MTDVTARLNYLQRIPGLTPETTKLDLSGAGLTHRQSIRVRAIGLERNSAERENPDEKGRRSEAERFVTALSAHRTPFAFSMRRNGGELNIEIGSWSQRSDDAASLRTEVIQSALHMLHAAIRIEPTDEFARPPFSNSGLVLGIPGYSRAPGAPSPADELIRGLGAREWEATVVAEPVALSTIEQLRGQILADMAEVAASQHHDSVPNPLAESYLDLGKQLLESYAQAMAQGAWRVAVYLCGDSSSYFQLAAIWRGLYSGDQSVPLPIRIVDDESAALASKQWFLSSEAYPPRPGHFRHHLMHQTILPSSALAFYCQLPRRETPGLRMFYLPQLDMEPPKTSVDGPVIGHVVRHPEEVIAGIEKSSQGSEVRLNVADLTSHALVVGSTGSGKTTTLFALVRAALATKAAFLIIEPAKREYRKLMDRPWCAARGFRVQTLGDERVAPVRINPFEPAHHDVTVAVHIDLLKSLFTASFGMWSPLPQILERCLLEVYTDLGWDIATNTNRRCTPGQPISREAWPTLSELRAKVDVVVSALGYDQKIADDMRAALVTRLNGLCIGAKGRMLNTRSSLSMSALLEVPTVLELEALGDDDDKAFVMGLILIRLYEHLWGSGAHGELRHLLVIEEAHRLLKQAEATGRAEDASPRAKAVETFANMLAEVRAYGEGIIIVDQSPSILAPAAIKNTNLKIAHRIVASEDRKSMAGAMGLTDEESAVFTGLPPGYAAMFGGRDDRPLLVRFENLKDGVEDREWPNNDRVRALNKTQKPLLPDDENISRFADRVDEICRHPLFILDFDTLVVALVAPGFAPEPAFEGLLQRIRSMCRFGENSDSVIDETLGTASRIFARRRSSDRDISFSNAAVLSANLQSTLLALRKKNMESFYRHLSEFRTLYRTLHVREFDPFPACARICPKEGSEAVCLYREFVSVPVHRDSAEPSTSEIEKYWKTSLDTAKLVLPDPLVEGGDAHTTFGLCLVQQVMGGASRNSVLRTIDNIYLLRERQNDSK